MDQKTLERAVEIQSQIKDLIELRGNIELFRHELHFVELRYSPWNNFTQEDDISIEMKDFPQVIDYFYDLIINKLDKLQTEFKNL